MRIVNLPPSTQVSTPSAATSRPAATGFSARLQGAGAPGAQPAGTAAVSGGNVLSSALASQQATPGGAVAGAYGLTPEGSQLTGLDASLAKMAKTPEQFAALKECVHNTFISNASSLFSMGKAKVEMERE
ncbi:hypothetical protein P2318_29535 [Myxococcaceae bacterium GXIMD 01537]